jgi:hypothetical protein
MFDNPLSYIPAVSGVLGVVSAVGVLASRIRHMGRESAHRRWTEQQEARLAAGGSRFRLPVLSDDRASLEWALAQGRLRVTKHMPWGWYVTIERRLTPRGQPFTPRHGKQT